MQLDIAIQKVTNGCGTNTSPRRLKRNEVASTHLVQLVRGMDDLCSLRRKLFGNRPSRCRALGLDAG